MAISAICLSIVFEPSCLAYRGDAGRTIPWVPAAAADTQIAIGVILMSEDEDRFSVSSTRYST